MEFGELKTFIREKEREGKVCFMTCEGLMMVDIEDFVKQSTESLLYDLNRDKITTMTLASEDNLRWVNDYAVAVVITELKRIINEREN